MNTQKLIANAIEVAKAATDTVADYKAETYSVVLLAQLLSPNASVAEPRPYLESTPNAPAQTKPFAPAEFFASKTWTSEIDKIVLAGLFAERHTDSQNFTVEGLRNILISAKVPLPNNPSLAIFQAVQRGWMMELPEKREGKKSYTLTQSGERHGQIELEKPTQ